MKPAPFEYVAARSIAEARRRARAEGAPRAGRRPEPDAAAEPALARPDAAGRHQPDRRPRRAAPHATASLHIGATVRQAALERSALVARHWPLLAQAVRHVGHPRRARAARSAARSPTPTRAPSCPLALTALDARYVTSPARCSRRFALEPRRVPHEHRRPAAAARRARPRSRVRADRGRLRRSPAWPSCSRRGHAAVAVLRHRPRHGRRAGAARGRERRAGRAARRPHASTDAAPPRAGHRAHPPRARRGGPRVKVRINGAPYEADVEPRTLLSRLHPRPRPDRHEGRLRARRLRRVHRPARRRAGPLLPDARGPGRRLRRHDDRGPRSTGRLQAGLPRAPRAPVRVLHRGHPDDARRLPARAPRPDRGRGQGGAGRQPLPLHGLRADHRKPC